MADGAAGSPCRLLEADDKARRRLARELITTRNYRDLLRKAAKLPEEEVQERDARPPPQRPQPFRTCHGRQEARESLNKKLQSLASLKIALSDARRGDAVTKRRRQIDRYVEIVQRLIRERKRIESLKKKGTTWTKIKRKFVNKKQEQIDLKEETKPSGGKIEAGEEEVKLNEEEIQPTQEIVEEEMPSEAKEDKKKEKKAEDKKRKERKQKKDKKKKQKIEDMKKNKGKQKKDKKNKKSEKEEHKRRKEPKSPVKKGKHKRSDEIMYAPPAKPLSRNIVLPEDALEPFRTELRAPPSSPLSPDSNIEVIPATVRFKDFVRGRRYVKAVHLRNVGARSVKFWLQEVEQSEERDVIEVSASESCFTLLTGLAMCLRVVFCPQQDAQGVTAQMTLRTLRPDSPERATTIQIRCEPSQAEPIVTPLELTIPTGSQFGSIWIDNKGAKSCTLNIENLPLQETGDLFEQLLNNVFREFQFDRKYHIPVGSKERVQLRVRFSPRGTPGPREEKFLFRFQEAPPQEVTVRSIMPPNLIVVSPLILHMGLCLSDDHVLQQGFYVTNSSKAPVPVSAHAQHKTARANRLTVIPSHSLVQAGHTQRMCVRLITSLEGDLELPIEVRAGQYRTVVRVYAESCPRNSISLFPERIDLGVVTSEETVSCALELRNNTQAALIYGFLDLPSGVSVQPGDGFGIILPGERVALHLLLSAEESHSSTIRCHTQSGSTATARYEIRVIQPQCRLYPSSITFPPIPCGSYCVVRAKLRALHDTKFEFKSSSEELVVMPRCGRLCRDQVITVLAVLRPEREEQKAERITCVTETAWFQVPVVRTVIMPDFVLQEDSACVEFGAVAMGTSATSALHLHNMGRESVSIVTGLLNPVGPFWCSLRPTLVDPGHVLVLPITFRPHILDEFQQEYLEVRGNRTVLPLVICGYGVAHKLTFHPDELLFRFDGTTGSTSVELRNVCDANLPIQIRQVFARQGPAPKQEKRKKKKGKSEPTLKPEVEAIIEGLSPAESAFSVEPRDFTVKTKQRTIVKVEYQARAANTMHAARYSVSLGYSTNLRILTFLATSGTLKKKHKEKDKQKGNKGKNKGKRNK